MQEMVVTGAKEYFLPEGRLRLEVLAAGLMDGTRTARVDPSLAEEEDSFPVL
jgi:hypothetical protein